MGRSRRTIAVLAAVTATMMLGGCAETNTPAATQQPSAGPTAEPSAAPAVWPTQLVATSCEELAPQALRDGVFGESLPAAIGRSNSEAAQSFETTAFTNAGGLACGWKLELNTGNPEDDKYVAVQLVPQAEAAATRIAAEMGSSIPASENPEAFCNWRACSFSALAGEYWVSGVVAGLEAPSEDGVVPESVRALFNSVFATAEALPSSDVQLWPAERAGWPTSCEEIATADELSSGLQLSGAVYVPGYNYEGTNASAGAILSAGGLVCGVATPSGSRFGRIQTLPGSAAAFAAQREEVREFEYVTTIHIDGLNPEDAYLTQRTDTAGALLSVNIDGVWMEISVADDVYEESPIPAVERLVSLAETLAAGA